MSLVREHHIFQLEVSVENSLERWREFSWIHLVMEKLQSKHKLGCVEDNPLLVKFANLGIEGLVAMVTNLQDMEKEVPTNNKLHHEIKVFIGLKGCQKGGEKGAPCAHCQNISFKHALVCRVFIEKLFFAYCFYSI